MSVECETLSDKLITRRVVPQLWMQYHRSCKISFIATNKMQKKGTDWNISKQSGRPEYQGPFLSPANRLVSTDRPADKPRTILQTSCSWNVCIQWQCKHLFLQKGSLQSRGQLQTTFGQLQTCVYSKVQYKCARKVPLPRRACGAHSELESL